MSRWGWRKGFGYQRWLDVVRQNANAGGRRGRLCCPSSKRAWQPGWGPPWTTQPMRARATWARFYAFPAGSTQARLVSAKDTRLYSSFKRADNIDRIGPPPPFLFRAPDPLALLITALPCSSLATSRRICVRTNEKKEKHDHDEPKTPVSFHIQIPDPLCQPSLSARESSLKKEGKKRADKPTDTRTGGERFTRSSTGR